MLYPTAFTFLVYFTVSLNLSARAFFVFLGILILTVLTAQSIGLLISAAVMNVKKAQVLASYWILSSMLASGYYIRPESIPKFLRPFRALSFIKVCFSPALLPLISLSYPLTKSSAVTNSCVAWFIYAYSTRSMLW